MSMELGSVDGKPALINRHGRKYALLPEAFQLLETANGAIVGATDLSAGKAAELNWRSLSGGHDIWITMAPVSYP